MSWGLIQFAGGWALVFAAGWLAGSGWSDLRTARWIRHHPVTEVGPPPRRVLDTMTPDELSRYGMARARRDDDPPPTAVVEIDGVLVSLDPESRLPWGPAGHATKEE